MGEGKGEGDIGRRPLPMPNVQQNAGSGGSGNPVGYPEEEEVLRLGSPGRCIPPVSLSSRPCVLLPTMTPVKDPSRKNLNNFRIAASESTAIAALRNISSAEETFRSAIINDSDGDGLGEYGSLSEMAGLAIPEGMTQPVNPPFIDKDLGMGDKSGYFFDTLVGDEGCTDIFGT